MSDIAIRVENLGKQYHIGALQQNEGHYSYKSLRDSIASAATAPFRAARALLGQKDTRQNHQDDTIWALKDVSFDVKQGEIVGVIGRNGAGKSTLLKLLSRITEPTTGRVEIHGRVGSLLEVGTGFHPELTGRDNVYLNGAILGMKNAEIAMNFDAIVAFAEVEKFIDTPVKHYSSGMYLRLAFAVAAHLQTEVLIVDEVLAVGDTAFQKKCLGKMQEVSKHESRTVIFVSHNMNAVESLCRRIVHLHQGQLVEGCDDPRTAIARYIHEGRSAIGDTEWQNTGNSLNNPWFFPTRFYVGDEFGNLLVGSVSNDSRTFIYIEGKVEEPNLALNVGYDLFDGNNQLMYRSAHTDTAEDLWPTLNPGLVRLRSPLPARTLNQGLYRLTLLISLYHREWICNPSDAAPEISLTIQGGLSDSPYWMERRPGIMAPVCAWETVSSTSPVAFTSPKAVSAK